MPINAHRCTGGDVPHTRLARARSLGFKLLFALILGGCTSDDLKEIPDLTKISGLQVKWVDPLDGGGTLRVNDVAALVDGGVVAGGKQSGEITFAAGSAEAITLDQADPFLARYDADGALLWLKHFGGTGAERDVTAAGVLSEGDIVIVGYTGFNLIFEEGTSDELTLTGADRYYVARFTPDGELVWAVNSTSAGSSKVLTIASDDTILIGGEGDGPFVHAWDAEGTALWTNISVGQADVNGIGADEEGVYLGGLFNDTLSFYVDGQVNTTLDVPNFNSSAGYVVKFDRLGRFLWAQMFAEDPIARVKDIAVDKGVFVCGDLSETHKLQRLSDEGVVEWTAPLTDLSDCESILAERGGVITGSSDSELILLDEKNGAVEKRFTEGGTSNGALRLDVGPTGDVFIAGFTQQNEGSRFGGDAEAARDLALGGFVACVGAE